MALVGEDERVVGQIFEQGRRRLAGPAAGEIARIVLDAGAGAGRLEHFEIEDRALLEPLRFEQPALAIEPVEALLELELDRLDRLQQRRARRHIVRIGVDFDEFEVLRLHARQRIELDDRLDLVAEEADAPGAVLVVGGEHLDRVAAHAEQAAREIAGLHALVLQRDEVLDELALVDLVAELQREGHRGIGLDRADAVDAGDGGDDDDVVALEQRPRRRVAHAVDLLVDVGFLLDIGVGARDVGLRLVIVVVGDEILDRVVGKEAPELAVELRGERLVGREDQRRALGRLDHLGHGEGLARAGDAEQHLVALVGAHALDQFLDRLRLVALRLEFGDDAKAPPALGLVRPRRPVRHPRRPVADVGVALVEQRLERFRAGRRADQAVRMALGRGALEFRLRRSPNPWPNSCGLGSTRAGLSSSARCSPSGWTSGREALDFTSRRVFWGGHRREYGASRGAGEGRILTRSERRADRGLRGGRISASPVFARPNLASEPTTREHETD